VSPHSNTEYNNTPAPDPIFSKTPTFAIGLSKDPLSVAKSSGYIGEKSNAKVNPTTKYTKNNVFIKKPS
jgi:hypothetical protein